MMKDLNPLRTLQQVVQSGSFTLAAAQLGLPKSTVSRQIAKLEDELGTQLFRRTTRKLQPTEAALRLARSMEQALQQIHEAENEILNRQPGLRGLLRVTAPNEFGASLLQKVLPAFLKRHPDLEVEIYLSDRLVDLIREGFDVAIRAGELEDSSFKARKLGSEEFMLVASPHYLKKHGTPKTPEDLKNHVCLRASNLHPSPHWEFHFDRKRVRIPILGPLAINNLLVLRDWAIQGLGLTIVPKTFCRLEIEDRKLIPVLSEWKLDVHGSAIHALYPAQRFTPPKVTAFVQFLAEELSPLL